MLYSAHILISTDIQIFEFFGDEFFFKTWGGFIIRNI